MGKKKIPAPAEYPEIFKDPGPDFFQMSLTGVFFLPDLDPDTVKEFWILSLVYTGKKKLH